jgi:predicted RNase H-like nuclease (RuvC/YqgF family)
LHFLAMSASRPNVTAAIRDASPDTDAAPHSAAAAAGFAPTAASPAAHTTASALPESSLAHELHAVQQRVLGVEEEINEAKEDRKACVKGSELWLRADDELKQLRDELKQLRDELKQLRTKEEQLRDELKRKELALLQPCVSTGSCQQKCNTAPKLRA